MKRLDKLLSDAGVAGRRELKQMIRQGRVQVDGRTVTVPEEKFDEKTAVVTVDGGTISTVGTYYYMMDKPAGVVTATEDRTSACGCSSAGGISRGPAGQRYHRTFAFDQ